MFTVVMEERKRERKAERKGDRKKERAREGETGWHLSCTLILRKTILKSQHPGGN
jgi:hypothetical protein